MSEGHAPLSPRNARVSAARRLLRRAVRRDRRRFLAEGPQAVREALTAAPGSVEEVFVDDARGHAQLVSAATAAGVPVREVDRAAVAVLSGTVTPQGVVAVCRF